jgi:hypothetical protein
MAVADGARRKAARTEPKVPRRFAQPMVVIDDATLQLARFDDQPVRQQGAKSMNIPFHGFVGLRIQLPSPHSS